MTWVRAYLALSSVMSEDSAVAMASLAKAPAAEAERIVRQDRRRRAEALAVALVDVFAALEEARL